MIRIASINLNKRLGNPKARLLLEAWLEKNQVDLLLMQEPWVIGNKKHIELNFFDDLGGTDSVRAWIRRKWKHPGVENRANNWQIIRLDFLDLHNVYLSAYESQERIIFLNILRGSVVAEQLKPVLITGDFNLAPTPIDGMVGKHLSNFTKEEERKAFNNLLEVGKIVDSTRTIDPPKVQYTIQRKTQGVESRFRCDLVLVSDYIVEEALITYDHSVRETPNSFTDHSAILINFPIDLPVGENQPLDLFEDFEKEKKLPLWQYSTHKTAMSRPEPSAIAKLVVKNELFSLKNKRILDFGCGRGADVEFYKSQGLNAEGWDPHRPFGYGVRPNGLFDVIVCAFVLNVLPNPYERIKALEDALSFLKNDGMLVAATRSPESIKNEGTHKKWERHNDGYWSSGERGTFQKGIGVNEISRMIKRLGYRIHASTESLKPIQDAVVVVIAR